MQSAWKLLKAAESCWNHLKPTDGQTMQCWRFAACKFSNFPICFASTPPPSSKINPAQACADSETTAARPTSANVISAKPQRAKTTKRNAWRIMFRDHVEYSDLRACTCLKSRWLAISEIHMEEQRHWFEAPRWSLTLLTNNNAAMPNKNKSVRLCPSCELTFSFEWPSVWGRRTLRLAKLE